MKKIIFSTILLIVFFQNGISQQEPLLKKYIHSHKESGVDTFTVLKEIIYNYDQILLMVFSKYLALFSKQEILRY